MPQLFQVLKCYKCSVFQVHQTKKANKWECKMCGEKQSIKRHYGLGTGKECRLHVQKLNGIREEIDELSETIVLNKNSDEELENDEPNTQNAFEIRNNNQSKWSNFIDEAELLQKPEENDSMYLGNAEVVLEGPVRKRKKFKPPVSSTEPSNSFNYNLSESVCNYDSNYPQLNSEPESRQRKMLKPNTSTYNCNTFFNKTSEVVEEVPVTQPQFYRLNSYTNEDLSEEQIPDKNIKTYIPPKVNKNSKWAELIDESIENQSINRNNSVENSPSQDNFVEHTSQSEGSSRKVADLFATYDESELDDILGF